MIANIPAKIGEDIFKVVYSGSEIFFNEIIIMFYNLFVLKYIVAELFL